MENSEHTFHIPVMGLAYTVDTPVKVARFGISSVISIIQDVLIENMRAYYCRQTGEVYNEIPLSDVDHRAKRITEYLNIIQRIVDNQIEKMKLETFEDGNDIVKYFQLLPNNSSLKLLYDEMMKQEGSARNFLQRQLKGKIKAGGIDVNIMSKIDNMNYDNDGELLPGEYSDAVSAMRGYANSNLSSSIVLSAGLNPRLFQYIEDCNDFFPDENGLIKKKIVLKVSDYRSALIQGKFLAKKGFWITEFRIESGLNCGGHAFPTEGHLLGPILEEFKTKKRELTAEMLELCNKALVLKGKTLLPISTEVRVTVQGGIGTYKEDKFLRDYYRVDGTGWGSPFLLVPEATNVDYETLQELVRAEKEDYYLSHSSPLGIPFNNFRHSSSETQRKKRMEKKRPGSPCYRKYLSFNTEFTDKPICVASREYQNLKIKELDALGLPKKEYEEQYHEITDKDCLCEGLSSSALIKNNIEHSQKLKAVAICPGPNLAYFSSIASLDKMIGHIYGRTNVLNSRYRSHMFVNELVMYVDYFKKEVMAKLKPSNDKLSKYAATFKTNLLEGIEYYNNLLPKMELEAEEFKNKLRDELQELKVKLMEAGDPILIPAKIV